MSKPSDPARAVLAAVREATLSPELAYTPTVEQRTLKANFWLTFKSNPLCDLNDISPALVEQLTGKSVQKYLSNKHFWEWFSARDSVKTQLEVAAEKASELAIFYLDPTVPFNDNARVQLIKYVLEFSGRSPVTRREEKWMDKEVAALDESQLDALIAKLTQKRLPEG